MTKMAAMSIYGKKPLKIFSGTGGPITIKTNPFAGKCVFMFHIIYVNMVLILGAEQYRRAINVAQTPEPKNVKWHYYLIWKQIDIIKFLTIKDLLKMHICTSFATIN